MQAGSLGEFLTLVADRRELQRVRANVHPHFELAEISRRVENAHTPQQPGPALSFDHVLGSSVPIVTNLLGSPERVAMAFGCRHLEEVSSRFGDFISRDLPSGWRARIDDLKRHNSYQQCQPAIVKEGDCQYVVRMGRDVDLTGLPWLHNWLGESGPSFSSAHFICFNEKTGQQVVERFPILPLDPQHLAMRWEWTSPLGRIWEKARADDRPLACALVFGGPTSLEAVLRWSPFRWKQPLLLTSILSQSRIDLVKCRTSDLLVPSTSEVVLEGTLDPKIATYRTGRVTNPMGFLMSERDCPIMKVACLTQRRNPVLSESIPHDGMSEAQSLNLLWEQVIAVMLKLDFPQVVDVHLPSRSTFGNHMLVAIDKQSPFEMRKLLHALWGSPLLESPRLIVGVDADISLRDYASVLKSISFHAHPNRDYMTTGSIGAEHDVEFASGRGLNLMGIDATRKWTGELTIDQTPVEWGGRVPREIVEGLQIKWQNLFEV